MRTITLSRRTDFRTLFVWLPDWWAPVRAGRGPSADAHAHADARSAHARRSTVIDHPMACWRSSFGI